MLRGVLVCLLGLIPLGCASADPACYPVRPGDAFQDVEVFDNHWHTGVMVPFMQLPADLRTQLGAFRECRYIGVGWGDGEFFRNAHPSAGIIVRALCASRGSVVLVFGFSCLPEEVFGDDVDIYRIHLRQPGFGRLVGAMDRSFARRDGGLIDAGPGPYAEASRFYESTDHYSVLHTCNQWTADLLHAGGLPITPFYAATAWNLAFQLRQLPDVVMNGRPLIAAHEARRVPRFIYGSHRVD